MLPESPFLYPIVDAAAVGEAAVPGTIERLTAAGITLLQLRAKDVGDRALVALARAAVAAAHRGGARLVLNDRVDVALLVGADGVHVGQDDLPPAEARALLGPEAIVGVSTHDLPQLALAAREPIDYVAIGPVFATTSKRDHEPVVGPALVRAGRAGLDVPLVAIGGITLSLIHI